MLKELDSAMKNPGKELKEFEKGSKREIDYAFVELALLDEITIY